MKMRMHLHLTEDVNIGAVDYLGADAPGRIPDVKAKPFVAVQIRGGYTQLKDGAAEVKAPLEVTQLYLEPQLAFQLATAILAAIPYAASRDLAPTVEEYMRRAG